MHAAGGHVEVEPLDGDAGRSSDGHLGLSGRGPLTLVAWDTPASRSEATMSSDRGRGRPTTLVGPQATPIGRPAMGTAETGRATSGEGT